MTPVTGQEARRCDVVAAKILAHTGLITRFPSVAAVASFWGVAPIEASSGEGVHHRQSRAGDRPLKPCKSRP